MQVEITQHLGQLELESTGNVDSGAAPEEKQFSWLNTIIGFKLLTWIRRGNDFLAP